MCVLSDDSQLSTIQLRSTKKEGFVPNMTLWTVKKLRMVVVNVRNDNDNGEYTCTVRKDMGQMLTARYTLTVAGEYSVTAHCSF